MRPVTFRCPRGRLFSFKQKFPAEITPYPPGMSGSSACYRLKKTTDLPEPMYNADSVSHQWKFHFYSMDMFWLPGQPELLPYDQQIIVYSFSADFTIILPIFFSVGNTRRPFFYLCACFLSFRRFRRVEYMCQENKHLMGEQRHGRKHEQSFPFPGIQTHRLKCRNQSRLFRHHKLQ